MCIAMDERDMILDAMSEDRDAHIPNLAKTIIENGGAQIIGPAGTGKTTFLDEVRAKIQIGRAHV